MTPTAHIPARLLPVRSDSAPVAYGAAKPPRLPNELISAIPPAAAAPVRNLGGSAQKMGRALKTPIAAMITGIITAIGWCRYSATGIAKPPTTSGMATCHTCSRVRSACRDHRNIATAAKT